MDRIRVEKFSWVWTRAVHALVRECRSKVAGPVLWSEAAAELVPGGHLPSLAGVDRDGRPLQSFVALDGDLVRGFLTVSPQGSIGECALPGDGPSAEAATALLAAAEEWARGQGAGELLMFRAPGCGPDPETLIRAGFRQRPAPAATLRVLDFGRLLGPIVAAREEELLRLGPLRLLIHTSTGPSESDAREIMVNLSNDAARVESGDSDGAEAAVRASGSEFTRFLVGLLSDADFLRGKNRVAPAALVDRVRAVLVALRLNVPWFNPLADHR